MPYFDFDVSSYEAPTKRNFEPLPPGDYNAMITDSQMKTTKAGTGEYLELTMQIIDGNHSGRRIWERLNVVNASKVAEEIARSQLNGIKAACNPICSRHQQPGSHVNQPREKRYEPT